jgi:hypothetical protein
VTLTSRVAYLQDPVEILHEQLVGVSAPSTLIHDVSRIGLDFYRSQLQPKQDSGGGSWRTCGTPRRMTGKGWLVRRTMWP